MSKFILQDQNSEMFIKSSSGRCLEITKELEDSAFFKNLENAEKTLRKLYDRNKEFKVSKTRYVDENFEHTFTFNSQAHKEKELKSGDIDAESIEVLELNLIVREVRMTLV